MNCLRLLARLLSLAVLLSLLPAPAAAQSYDGLAQSSIHIESFDGTRLAITIYQPSAGGRVATETLPVIVTQNRGEVNERTLAEMRRYTDHGYVWVAQDRRGTGASFGLQTGFVNQFDARDAKAVIDWSAAQGFSSGKTVALGCSNQGAWQYLVATLRPASLVAIAPACSSPMFYDDAVAIGGIPMIGLSPTAYAGECREGNVSARPGNMPAPAPRPVDRDTDGALLRAAQAEQRCGAPMLGQYALNQPRDTMNAYAGNQPALADIAMTNWEILRDSGIAVFQSGGWFDAATAGQIEGQRVFGGHFVIGAWMHGNRPPQGAALPNGTLDLTAMTLSFFDQHAKGINGGEVVPAIQYYTVGAPAGAEWRSAESWPDLPRSTLYIGGDGTLSPFAPSTTTTAAADAGGARWFDGRYAPLARWFTGDFTATNAGSLLHDSAPMPSAVEITGTVTASLWISADQPDANVFAMLQDVAPDGSATYITDGRLRASWRAEHDLPWPGEGRTWHRGNAEDILPLTPGEPALLRFDFFPVSYVLHEGHTLRLTITSSIGQSYDAAPLAQGQPVTLTLHSGPQHPSALSLPVLSD